MDFVVRFWRVRALYMSCDPTAPVICSRTAVARTIKGVDRNRFHLTAGTAAPGELVACTYATCRCTRTARRGFCEGDVLYHRHVHKTDAEVASTKKKLEKAQKLKVRMLQSSLCLLCCFRDAVGASVVGHGCISHTLCERSAVLPNTVRN